MELSVIYGHVAAVLCIALLALWLLSVAIKDASIIDIFWGFGFVITGAVILFLVGQQHPRTLLICTLCILWGLRLTAYLFWRNVGNGEDKRYVAMRKSWGPRFWWVSFFTVFCLQGVLIFIVSQPLQMTASAPGLSLNWLDFVGVAIFVIGFGFEAISDYQLSQFLKDETSHGKVMNLGLWRYTRHPNYFGNFCIWWGLGCIALSSDYGWWSLLSPVIMSYLLVKVSGVAMLERTIGRRRQGYDHYSQTTSAFWPRPPKSPHTARD